MEQPTRFVFNGMRTMKLAPTNFPGWSITTEMKSNVSEWTNTTQNISFVPDQNNEKALSVFVKGAKIHNADKEGYVLTYSEEE